MVGPILVSVIGAVVHRNVFHLDCAPDGITRPILDCEEGVDRLACTACAKPLVDLAEEPELEEYEGDFCQFCGAALSQAAVLAGATHCDVYCEAGSENAPF